MNKITMLLLLAVLCACSSNDKQKIADGIETIPVETQKAAPNAASFLQKIEIIPLETNDESLFHRCNKVIYDKSTDIYAIYTSDQIVFTFSGNGKYIANSKRMKGQGPEEYTMVLDIKFNPYLKGIDMLNPYGTIYTYSPTFELLSKKKFKPEFPLEHFMPLDADNYVFTYTFIWTGSEVAFVNLKTQQTVNANYEGTISGGNTMSDETFYHIGENFYLLPRGVNYYFYQIDAKEKKLIPIMYLDLGDAEVKADGLPGQGVGKRTDSDEERSRLSEEMLERYRFLKYSDNLIPSQKFFNDDYVYVYLTKGDRGHGSHFIYDRKKKEGFLIKDGKPFIMYPCFGIVDNALLTICQPEYVRKIVDLSLMSPEEVQKMEQVKEDDNPVIVKYYLKK